ncbi:MAG: HTTM domain-containing protein [Chloroflexi bacterium]|nr:HTTM domain-containing protein [Chloroflexota bacterium]
MAVSVGDRRGEVNLTSSEGASPTAARQTVYARLFAPVDIASLAAFRVLFGTIMLWEVWRYVDLGRIERYYVEPRFFFTYPGFDWVRPWPDGGMVLHFMVLGALAICIALGLWYRASAALFFLGFTYIFLLDQAQYLNHFYLISLISFLLIWAPAHRAWSLDAWRRPALRAQTAPAWTLGILRAQIAIVYVFGGIAKLNGDWLRGEPMRLWLAERTDFPIIGALFTEEWMVYLFSYGGLLLDLLIVPLLLWRPTRLVAMLIGLVFHLTNSQLFNIGIFPWFMIAANLLFLPSDWPRRVLRLPPVARRAGSEMPLSPRRRLILAALGVYAAVQILLPLRHFLYPGDVNWTEEGHLFSWHMRLRDKRGFAQFFVTNPQSGVTWEIQPLDYLTERQVDQMVTQPDMILQFSHFLAEELRRQGHDRIEVRVWSMISLNGRRSQPLIDFNVDLAQQPRTLLPAAWIRPLHEPLTAEEAS